MDPGPAESHPDQVCTDMMRGLFLIWLWMFVDWGKWTINKSKQT